MLNPFLLMAVFYLIVALIAAVDAALTSFTLLPWTDRATMPHLFGYATVLLITSSRDLK